MKMIKKLIVGALIIAPLLLAPAKSRASGLGDFFQWLFGGGKHHHKSGLNDPAHPASGPNAVPVNGGIVILLVAGLGLGAKIIYDKKSRTAVITEAGNM